MTLLIFNYFVLEQSGIPGFLGSPLLIIPAVLLMISTVFCSIERIWTLARYEAPQGKFSSLKGEKYSLKTGDIGADAIDEYLLECFPSNHWLWESRRWKEKGVSYLGFITKEKYGQICSITFHLAMIAVAIAMVLINLTYFLSFFIIGEGEQFGLTESNMASITSKSAFIGSPLDGRPVSLVKLDPRYYKGLEKTEFTAYMKVNGIDHQLKVNRPLNLDGFNLILRKYGFAPRFIVTEKKSNKQLLDAYVKLQVINREDSFTVPSSNIEIKGSFYPDFIEVNGEPHSRTYLPKKPVFKIAIKDGDSVIYSGYLKKDSPVDAGRYRVEFKETSYWVGLAVAKENGVFLFYGALFILVLSLMGRFLIPTARIVISISTGRDGSIIEMVGQSSILAALFEDKLQELWDGLTKVAGK